MRVPQILRDVTERSFRLDIPGFTKVLGVSTRALEVCVRAVIFHSTKYLVRAGLIHVEIPTRGWLEAWSPPRGLCVSAGNRSVCRSNTWWQNCAIV